MSVRVLRVRPGNPYPHSFLDDLESFFWLILWSAAAHRDPKSQTTYEAQDILNSMSDCNLRGLMSWKKGQLLSCLDGDMSLALDAFGNKWASDRVFADVIVGLGGYFGSMYLPPTVLRRPAEVFSRIVEIIESALSLAPSE